MSAMVLIGLCCKNCARRHPSRRGRPGPCRGRLPLILADRAVDSWHMRGVTEHVRDKLLSSSITGRVCARMPTAPVRWLPSHRRRCIDGYIATLSQPGGFFKLLANRCRRTARIAGRMEDRLRARFPPRVGGCAGKRGRGNHDRGSE